MKKGIVVSLIFLSGCVARWVYAPAPNEPVSLQTAAVASGVLKPRDFYFTLISQYQPSGQARVIVLTEPALKLADLTVSKEQLQVHYKAAQIPGQLIRAWGQLVREQFLTPCPARKISYKSSLAAGTFELDVTGGICL